MSDDRPHLTILLVPEGTEESHAFRISYRRLKVLAVAAGVLAVVLLGVVASWSYLAVRSTRVDDLEAQVEELEAQREQVMELSKQLADLEDRYEGIRSLFGTDQAPTSSGVWLPSVEAEGPPGRAVQSPPGATRPESWPLTERGFLTQGLLDGAEGEHPGIDIAVPTDSYIRAAGGGTVVEVGEDPVYGNFVVLEHADGYRSLYAHASLTLVEEGDSVRRDEVIALSGSTGRSTAPHLHFEIQRDGEAVDPLTLVSPP